MKLDEFIKITCNLPVIETEFLSAGVVDSGPLKVQISRWVKAGKLIQLRRGVYLLSKEYRKRDVFEPFIASILKKPSYLSLEKALEFHGLIPEAVPVYTSVTTKRAARFISEAGEFVYQHIKQHLFWGYASITLNNQTAFIATPEKALLDLIYFKGRKISPEYIEELRLQNEEKINLDKLFDYAKRFKKPKMMRAARIISDYIRSQKEGVKQL